MLSNSEGKFICKQCGKELNYNGIWDSYFCESCNEWAEEKCSDINCTYCAERPDTPIQK